jgi:hypothetical protein
MKSLQDTLYNWLTIKVVCDARPNDTAARDTLNLFEEMLTSEHHLFNIEITTDEVMYYVSYQHGEETKKTRYPRELIEMTLDQINKDPERYENYPLED